jgi:hypothetical protein
LKSGAGIKSALPFEASCDIPKGRLELEYNCE